MKRLTLFKTMQKATVKLLATFIGATLIFLIGKLVFIGLNHGLYSGIGFSGILSVLGHGLSMDFSMAGYLTVIPAILLCVSLSTGSGRIIGRILNIYFIIVSLVVSLIVMLDATLYSYWRFKLDSTPLFYFFSSPSSAMASAEWWQLIAGPVLWLILASVYYVIFLFGPIRLCGDIKPVKGKRLALPLTVMIILTALLFIPIRGGVTVSTMNLSRAYFSADTRMNHAAVNPAFSLMYSLTHQNNFADQYRFMTDEEAQRLFADMRGTEVDSVSGGLLGIRRPDVYIILLESFSSHLFPSLGGESVALRLDSVAREGLLFTRFFASSFRTDRGIPSVLSAYPGQPSTSIMKFVSKTENLPSLSKAMKEQGGYRNTYYYGGDANFTNMKAYLVSAGFDRIVSDVDFPVSSRLSKWGAHDEVVFRRVADELTPYDPASPQLRVIQTSSSHEPFEVPYDDKGRFTNPRAKAFAYADSCAADFINLLAGRKDWENSLVVLVPDHYGAYPELDNPVDRHRIPLILTGGALARKGTDSTVGSQTDITATLLDALGMDHGDFPFSKNLLDPESPHFAFFADPSDIGLMTQSDSVVYNLNSDKIMQGNDSLLPKAKAFLQTLYNDLSKR